MNIRLKDAVWLKQWKLSGPKSSGLYSQAS